MPAIIGPGGLFAGSDSRQQSPSQAPPGQQPIGNAVIPAHDREVVMYVAIAIRGESRMGVRARGMRVKGLTTLVFCVAALVCAQSAGPVFPDPGKASMSRDEQISLGLQAAKQV